MQAPVGLHAPVFGRPPRRRRIRASSFRFFTTSTDGSAGACTREGERDHDRKCRSPENGDPVFYLAPAWTLRELDPYLQVGKADILSVERRAHGTRA